MAKRISPLLLAGALVFAAGLAGCKSYQAGFLSHPQIDSIAVGPFENATPDATLAATLRSRLAEAFMRDGSISLEDYDAAETVVRGRVVGVRSRQVAAIKGDDSQLSDYQSEYRGAVYRVYLVVEFEVIVPRQNGRAIIAKKRVTGEADYPNTPDVDVARSAALNQAANDAARQIAAAITEAW